MMFNACFLTSKESSHIHASDQHACKHHTAKAFELLLAHPSYVLLAHAYGLLLDPGFCILKACGIVYRC